ncbi:50S ribosomal protein L22 [Boudabousia liubingyangii]|uniref:Large ribosomal subunit protein uL22 n=1 Tax=Boudabousia liubingyangii TaxID=1921764 RepID=A0A1Q5PQB4_9ACTO|nr:50S ribosomal protein L22 [Boudabousia liubingyangii]OKL48249.1 50S ribosomal protein L22 [Boudabousia liubingyangii]OKL49716.1 50S ribosomal protein L22 [Boudabousia liubingyangii]
MEAKAKVRYLRVTPQKARRVVDVVRGKRVLDVLDILQFAPQAVAVNVRKLVVSAMENARQAAQAAGEKFNEGDLYIKEAFVDEGPTMKRFRPRAQGRAGRINKRTCHITVVVDDVNNKQEGTK